MSNKAFSVAMSIYIKDKAVFLDRALRSITDDQTIKPNEIVLVCDGPITDECETIIRKYCNRHSNIKVIRLEKNVGLGHALKVAIENASYEIVARMDSDDVSVSNRFEQQLSFFEKNAEVDILGGDITEFIDREDNIIGRRSVPQQDAEIKDYMKRRCAFNHVTVMFKKNAVLSAGGYQECFWNEDYYLWIRMQLQNAVFANTGTVLVNVRVGEEMYQRRGGTQYFKSELHLQKMMLKSKMINLPVFVSNVGKRIIVQILLPIRIRGWVFRTFARSKIR